MKIIDVEINGFRSISNNILKLSRINLLAGKNGSGKSNILRAIDVSTRVEERKLDLGTEDFCPDFRKITCDFNIQLSQKEIKAFDSIIKNYKHSLPKPVSDYLKYYYYNLSYSIELSKADLKKPAYYLGYKKIKSLYSLFGQNADSQINYQILEEFQKSFRNCYRLITIGGSFLGIDVSEHNRIAEVVMSQFTSGDPAERAKYNKLRDALFYITEGVGGEIQPAKYGDDKTISKFRIRYEVEKKLFLPATHSGDGAKRVAYILYYLINSPFDLIAIEEPEICLHPGAQKRFRKVLDELCGEYQKQMIISSHSPIFLEGWSTANLYNVEIQKGLTVTRTYLKIA